MLSRHRAANPEIEAGRKGGCGPAGPGSGLGVEPVSHTDRLLAVERQYEAEREHRVPLSGRTLQILAQARELADGSGLIFPSK